MEMTLMTARARPLRLGGRRSRGIANLQHSLASGQSVVGRIPAAVVMEASVQNGQVAGG